MTHRGPRLRDRIANLNVTREAIQSVVYADGRESSVVRNRLRRLIAMLRDLNTIGHIDEQ